ncbi:MAG: hypothetical protein GY820_26055 [Gammaproteobacteria bacterium]|nr:hypothetical protein [Gammaproteobacteria bacterium]
MLTKILVTILVIIGCMWTLAARRNNTSRRLRTVPNPKNQQKQKLLRQAAWSFMLLMVIAAGVMVALELQDNNTIVTVHVINTQSGQSVSYQARREDIQSNSFITVGGRKIFTAGIERIEIEAPD